MSFSDANDIPWIKFEKDEAKLEVMQPHLARQAGTGRSGMAAIGVARESLTLLPLVHTEQIGALLLLLTGRPAALRQLSGPGTASLRQFLAPDCQHSPFR